MRLWVFGRSGLYSSKKFDIHEEPERFVKVIAGYALMTDAELGLNTFIKRDGNGKYIVARDVRISLEDKPIALTKAIVCRGTTCYRGRRSDSTEWEYVVKFAWPSDKRQRDLLLLYLELTGNFINSTSTSLEADVRFFLSRALKICRKPYYSQL
jgi:hypothetical protein